ncbi:MAG: proline dehydrogenase family protein [Anaerolineales bacterium]|nr:MAG: proline dehydrogenase family protein [Anaerolineales bacterium]
MLRSFLIYLSQADWARRLIMSLGVSRRMARRFVAGDELSDALHAVRRLNNDGMLATLDLLGEHTADAAAANASTARIIEAVQQIAESGVRSGVSIKLTQLGLKLDLALVESNLRQILQAASERQVFVRIDMEDSPWVDTTLTLYRKMRAEGLHNVGVVIQSYLYRSEADVLALIAEGARIRVVKGAYMEPADRAFPDKADVDAAYDRLADLLLHAGHSVLAAEGVAGPWPPMLAVASQDLARIQFAKQHAAELGIPKTQVEFQMLFGIRRDLQQALAAEGYPVRIYVPYGREWYPYFMRRLAERPANLWFFLTNLVRR